MSEDGSEVLFIGQLCPSVRSARYKGRCWHWAVEGEVVRAASASGPAWRTACSTSPLKQCYKSNCLHRLKQRDQGGL